MSREKLHEALVEWIASDDDPPSDPGTAASRTSQISTPGDPPDREAIWGARIASRVAWDPASQSSCDIGGADPAGTPGAATPSSRRLWPSRYSESLPGAMRHLSDAWARRGEPNVLLVHYDDLLADLEGQMRRLAGRLGIAVPEQSWPVLAGAATFERMRDRKDILVPSPPGIVADTASFFSFFRRGTSGAGREILSDEEMAGYYARAARFAPPDMLKWLHRQLTGR